MILPGARLLRDALYALRLLRRHRAFNTAMVLTIAVVIGAGVCVFIPLYAIVFRNLAIPASDRMVMLWESNRETGLEHVPLTEGAYAVYRQSLGSFQDLAAFIPHNPVLPPVTLAETGERITEINATPELFHVLDSRPWLGRTFEASESEPGAPQVAILSYRWWNSHFSGKTEVIGRTLTLNYFGSRENYTIVGVMAANFEFPRPLYPERPDVWLSLPYDHQHFSPGNNFYVIGKLKPNVLLSECQAELATAAARLALAQPRFYGSQSIQAVPLKMELVNDAKTLLIGLISALLLVLLIGCSNIVNLVIARATWRAREAYIRIAIGATRGDIARQLAVEIGILALLGGGLGLLVGLWGTSALPAVLPRSVYIPRIQSLVLDWPVLLFAFTLCLTVALGVGFIAASNVTRKQTNLALRGLRPFRRPGGTLLIAEVALAVMLVSGAVVTFRGLSFLLKEEARVDPERLLVMDVFFSNDAPEHAAAIRAAYGAFLLAAPSVQGVKDVALVDDFPLKHYPQFLVPEGGPGQSQASPVSAEVHVVTPSYFPTMGFRAIAGRLIDSADGAGAQASAVVNETFARRYFGRASPLGVFLFMERRASKEWPPTFRIVGIVEEPLRFGSGDLPAPTVYLSFMQAPMRNLAVVVRTSIDPRKIASVVRDRVLQLVPGKVSVNSIRTGREIVADSSARAKFISTQLAAFALLALALAGSGIYGLISFYTSRRTHEIGVRLAVGSTRFQVVSLVVKQGMALVGTGIGFGLTTAPMLVRLLIHTGYYIRPLETGAYAAVGVLFSCIGLIASYVPARRASLIEPGQIMRSE